MIKPKSNVKLYVLCLLAFFASLIQNIYTPIIPRLHNEFHVSLLYINLTVGVFIFIIAIMQIILGGSIDTKDSKQLLLTGLSIIILSSFICSITHNFFIFAISRSVQAIGCGMIPLVTLTLLARSSTGNERASAMANYQIFLSSAPALAPILGSILGANWNYFGIFIFIFIIAVLLFIVISFIEIPNIEKGANRTIKPVEPKYFTDHVFITFILFGFLVFFTYFSILVDLPILLTHRYHLNEGWIGFLFLPITISVIMGSVFYKWISKIKDELLILRYTVLAFSVVTLLFGIMNSINIIILAIIIFGSGFLVGIVPAILSTLITQRYENIKGKVLGVFNFIRYIGMTIGAITIGLVTPHNTYLYFLAVSVVIFIVFFYLMTKVFERSFKVETK